LIGVLLAIFVLAALVGGVVSLGALLGDNAVDGYGTPQGLSPQTIHVLWVIGFLAGFSDASPGTSSTGRRAAPAAISHRPAP
jgi:hypothetical protein